MKQSRNSKPGSGVILIGKDALLSSSATGDAIVMCRSSFDNQVGAEALSTPNGRWLVHTDGASSTQLGGLPYHFVQFNVGESTTPAQQSGNGLLHTEALDLQGRISRVYDGTVNAALGASTIISGAPAGFQANMVQAGQGSFEDRNVGRDQPITLTRAPVLDVTYDGGKPVYGHSTHYTGDITPASLDFLADPALGLVGRNLPVLSKTVSGFVAEESWPADWSTTAESSSSPGAYPVYQVVSLQHQPALPLIQRKIAVLFGINDYGDRRIPRLESAIPDVEAVSRVLEAQLGHEVRVLRNPGKADIIRILNQVSLEARPADSVLTHYAGHGYSLEKHGAGYWIPADAPVDDPTRWLSNADISRLLAGYQPRQTVLISDSCYSGAFAREALDGLGSQVDARDVLSKRSVVVLSSGGDEPVTDEGKEGHSIFVWNFMQSVNSVQRWTPGNSIFRQVQTAVTKEFPQTPRYGAVTAAGHQRGGEYLFEVR